MSKTNINQVWRPATVKCTGCDYSKSLKSYWKIVIRPKSGVLTSQVLKKYCVKCENFSMWFMGKGVENIESEELLNWSINHQENKIKNIQEEIIELKKYSFLRLNFTKKLNHLKRQIDACQAVIKELSINTENIKISESVKFYNALKAKPSCMECGFDKFDEIPKHNCGGNLFYDGMELEQQSIEYRIGLIDKDQEYILQEKKLKLYEYDQYGNITIYKAT